MHKLYHIVVFSDLVPKPRSPPANIKAASGTRRQIVTWHWRFVSKRREYYDENKISINIPSDWLMERTCLALSGGVALRLILLSADICSETPADLRFIRWLITTFRNTITSMDTCSFSLSFSKYIPVLKKEYTVGWHSRKLGWITSFVWLYFQELHHHCMIIFAWTSLVYEWKTINQQHFTNETSAMLKRHYRTLQEM